MQRTPWLIAGILLLAGAGAGLVVFSPDEPARALQAGDRIAYNVTRDDRTWTYVGEVVGTSGFVDSTGQVQDALTIRWLRDAAETFAYYDDGRVLSTQGLRDEESEYVYRDPLIPYDETSEYMLRSQQIRYPDDTACMFASAGPCFFVPHQRTIGGEEPVSIVWDERFPVAFKITWDQGTAQLVGYDRQEPPAVPARPDDMPPLVEVDATPMPPADIPMGFTLDEALDAVRTDPTFFYFQQWLDAHPDHYIAEGGYGQFRTAGYTGVDPVDHSWTLVFTDGVEEYAISVVKRSIEGPAGAIEGPGLNQPLMVSQRGGWETRFPPASEVPGMPSWSQLVARAEAYAMDGVQGLPVLAWHFALKCGDEPCSAPHWLIRADLLRDERTLNPTVNTLVIPDVDLAALEFQYHGENGIERLSAWQERASHSTSIGDPAPVSSPRPAPEDNAVAMAVPAGAAGLGLLLIVKFLAPLFSRVRPDRLLEHPVRQDIAAVVAAEPGVHLSELERRLTVPASTLKHHIRKMVEGERLQQRRVGRYTCLFPPGPIRGGLVAEAGVTRSDGAQQILQVLEAHPGLGVRDLAERTGMNPSTISYHAKRLEAAGSVIAKRDGRVKRLRLA